MNDEKKINAKTEVGSGGTLGRSDLRATTKQGYLFKRVPLKWYTRSQYTPRVAYHYTASHLEPTGLPQPSV